MARYLPPSVWSRVPPWLLLARSSRGISTLTSRVLNSRAVVRFAEVVVGGVLLREGWQVMDERSCGAPCQVCQDGEV
ncbi:hypothetical protein HOY80DRAFT_964364, partial [Tuber brumale]